MSSLKSRQGGQPPEEEVCMRGKVLTVAGANRSGFVSGDDGVRYQYDQTDLRSAAPNPGQEVDFEVAGALAHNVYAIAPATGGRPAPIPPKRDWVQFYLSPSGRITRRDYWLYGFLVIFAINLLLGWIPILGQILTLLTLWPSIAVAFKRLHDRSKAGWWIFVPSIPTIVGAVLLMISLGGSNGDVDIDVTLASIGGLLLAAGFGASLWIIFGVLARSGVTGPNQYGPDPMPARF